MTTEVRDAYDAMAERYTAHTLGDLERNTVDRDLLAAFADLAAACDGPVADLGCGPGHVVDHLAGRGVTAIGYDLSPRLIATARRAFPDAAFHVGDHTALDLPASSLGGIVARYSLIHMRPSLLTDVFDGWRRLLQPGAPILVSFFAAASADTHGTAFDHAVTTAYALFPATVAGHLRDAGFDRIDITTRRPHAGERPLDHATVLARHPDRPG